MAQVGGYRLCLGRRQHTHVQAAGACQIAPDAAENGQTVALMNESKGCQASLGDLASAAATIAGPTLVAHPPAEHGGAHASLRSMLECCVVVDNL